MNVLRLGRIRNGRRRRARIVTLAAAVATASLTLLAVGATPALAAPLPPTNVAATPINARTIHVSWTDNSGGTAKYVVSNGNVSSADLPAGTTSYNWGGLAQGTYMCFTVAAKNTSGQSAWSPYACATIPYVPPAPTGVAAAATDSATIHVSWTDNSGGTAKYVVSNGNVSSADLPAGTTSYDWSGLSPGTYMCFTVAAKNTSGQSAWSPYACATTPALSCQATLQPSDSSGDITFYHGTADAYAKDIAANGINLSKGSGNADFGGGFYITTNVYQAEEWAWKNFASSTPTVVEYKVPAIDLAPGMLCGHVFSSANSSWQSFVLAMRTNQPSTGGAGYGFVEGPLLLNPNEFKAGAAPIWGGQQDSIHTLAAVSIFNSGFITTFAAPTLVPQTIRSLANGNYVSTELGYTGSNYAMLRARQSSQGTWETYSAFHYNSDNQIGFYSTANFYWVSTEIGYTGSNYAMLRARASTRGSWEDYNLIENGDGTYSLQSQANGMYVSAELGYTGSNYAMLRARSSTIGPWEKFTDDSPSVNCSCE
jgi:hypothetical protein